MFLKVLIWKTNLSLLGLVLVVLGEEVGEDVSTAAGDVDQGPLLAQTQAGRHGHHHGQGLDEQGPLAQVAPHDESTQDSFYLFQKNNTIGTLL